MREPHFWSAGLDPQSREAAPLTRVLATPFAWLYAAITARRIRRTAPQDVTAHVVCIGNLTAGGTGKSPVVTYVRDYLQSHIGWRTASLSRGYGGQLKGPVQVDCDHHSAEAVGDEPLMLATSGESWIGADRAAAGRAMSEAGVEAIIMDDGHQNPTLKKDLSIIVVDSHAAFGNGYVIPKGPLREPVEVGLARADAIVLMGSGTEPEALETVSIPILRAHLVPKVTAPKGPLIAFAGIGRPEKFFDSLTELGANLKDTIPFSDHHRFTERDILYLRALAADHRAQLITTEKDYARLSPAHRASVLTLPVEIQFEKPDMFHALFSRLRADSQI